MIKLNVYFILFLLLIFSLIKQSNAQTVSLSDELNKKLASAGLINDLDFILEKVSKKGNDRTPYNFISEADFNQQVKKVKEYFLVNDSLTIVDFYKKVGPLLTLLKDDHSLLKLGNKRIYAKLKNNLSVEHFVFPLSTLVYNDSCYVAASDTLPIKSKIISINDIPIMDIVKQTLKHVNFSEYFAVKRNIITAFDFPKYAVDIWALYNFENEAKVKYIPYGSGSEKEIIITLYPFFDKKMTKNWKVMPFKMDRKPSLKFKNDIAILRLPSFFAGRNIKEIAKGLEKWIEYFDKTFREINSKNPKKLLIDISNNGGGSDFVGYILLNYLYNGKLKTSFYSNELTPKELFTESIIPVIVDSLGTKIKFEKYKGEVNLFISGRTFSAAARFADWLKTFSIGKIIGRETKGFRTHYGEAKWFDLKKTGLGFQISTKFLVSASGDMEPHGVFPDYEIKINNVDDLFGIFGNDYLLKEAKNYLSNS